MFDTNIDKIFPKNHPSITKSKELNKNFSEKNSSTQLSFRLKTKDKVELFDKTTLNKISTFVEEVESHFQNEFLGLTKVEFAYEKESELVFGKVQETTLDSKIKQNILSSSIFVPNFINENATELYFYSDSLSESQIAELKSLALSHGFVLDHFLSNQIIQSQVLSDLGVESIQNFTLSFVILILLSFFLYQGFSAAGFHSLLYILNCLSSIFFLGLLGWKLNSLSISLPIILIVIQISMGSHLLLNRFNLSFSEKIKQNILPIGIALGSTFLGFASLYLNESIFLKDYAKSICVAILISSVQFFALLYLAKALDVHFKKREHGFIQSILYFFVVNIKKRAFRNTAIVFSITTILLGGFSTFFLNSKEAPTDLLRSGTDTFQSLSFHRENTRGAQQFYIKLDGQEEGYWEDLENLRDLERVLVTWKQDHKVILNLQSYLDSLYLFNKDFQLPKSDQELAEIGFLMGMMGSDTTMFASGSKTSLRLNFSTIDKSYDKVELAVNDLKANLKEQLPSVEINLYGSSYDQYIVREELSYSLLGSFAITASLILCFLMFLWKKPRLVLIAALPNLVPVAALSIFLMVSQWSFDPLLSIIFSIAVGIAFDNTIFFLNDWLSSPESKNQSKTIGCYSRKAEDVFTSNFSLLACFSVFLFSQNEINFRFGLLMGLSVVFAYFADAVILPSLLWRREKRVNSQNTLKEYQEHQAPKKDIETYEAAI